MGWVVGLEAWMGGGVIAFDYEPRTFRFASSIDEAEARGIVARMRGNSRSSE